MRREKLITPCKDEKKLWICGMAKKHNEKVITAPESNLDDYPGKCEKQKHSKLVLLLKSEEH